MIKKNNNLASLPSGNDISKQMNCLESVVKETYGKIQQGLEKTNASTGTPIKKLNGGAKFMAQMSNIGGGSVKTGGGGIKEGFNTIATYIYYSSKLNTLLKKK